MASITQGCNVVAPSATGVEFQRILEGIRSDLVALTAQHNQMRTDYNAHVHGGITAGAASSAATTATTATAVNLVTSA